MATTRKTPTKSTPSTPSTTAKTPARKTPATRTTRKATDPAPPAARQTPAKRPAAPRRRPRPVDDLFGPAVEQALAAASLAAQDGAAARLARRYAAALDAVDPTDPDAVAGSLERIGPRLLATLAELGATPAGRARILGAHRPPVDAEAPAVNRIKALRAARDA